MKDFNDLVFQDHPNQPFYSTQATMDFDNGYGISVITGKGAYSSETSPYEVAVLKNGVLCYSTDITDDVLGYNTKEDVSRIMKQVQEL